MDFAQISSRDLARVGGKNASLGELFRASKPKGVGVLDGFATTAHAYRRLLRERGLDFSAFDAVVAENGAAVWLPESDRTIVLGAPPSEQFLGRLRFARSLGDRVPKALHHRIGDLARVLQGAVGRLLEVPPRSVRGAGEPCEDPDRLTLVSAQDGELLSRFIAKLANPISGVCFDLPLRTV